MASIPVTIIRHPKEKLSKCSLQPLVGRPELTFLKATPEFTFDATGFLLLTVDAPKLSNTDQGHPLLLLDSTWRLLPKLESKLTGTPILRSLPNGIKTAYPRVSKVFEDPLGGLASVEALYLAKLILGEEDKTLLADYEWRNDFLRNLNQTKRD